MKIIDAHMHYSKISSFGDCARRTSDVDYSAVGYQSEKAACNIVRSICMGLYERPPSVFPDINARTPMLADLSEVVPSGIVSCFGINPHTLSRNAVDVMDAILRGDVNGIDLPSHIAGSVTSANVADNNMPAKFVGIKIYAGYYHFDVCDPIYTPAYNFAEKHNLPVVIHSGDTYSDKGLLVYAQPLSIDKLAVDRPDMRIVLCHMGAPWVYDACEVVGKNKNVYMDISGMLVGNADYFAKTMKKELVLDRYRQALQILDDYDKVLFGTDWPLAPMASYIEFCKKLVPPESYAKVFHDNAAKVFNISD